MSSYRRGKARSALTDPTVLSVCLNMDRTQRREQALTSAGFRIVSATTFEAAQAMSQHHEFSIVVLDHECCSPLPSLTIKPPFVILGMESDDDDSLLVKDLLTLCGQHDQVANIAPIQAA